MQRFARLYSVLLGLSWLPFSVFASAAFPPYLSSKTPYQPQQQIADYQSIPTGYQLVFTELLARHGARTMTGGKSDLLSYQLWQQAQKSGALTALGKTLGPQLAAMIKANQALGYGQLTQLGREEHQQLAGRLVLRDQLLFQQAIAQDRKISVQSSGKGRAVDSAENFVLGLKQAQPALTPLLLPPEANPIQLYFHKNDSSKPYRNYLKKDAQLKATLAAIKAQAQSQQMARQVLERIYTKQFVDQLGSGELPTPLAAAQMLYDLYAIAPGMQYEGQWQFSQFIPAEAAKWFAYLNDAEDFYQKGPAFQGQDITYRMAQVLVDDFFNSIKQLQGNASPLAAKLRFSHAEVVIPFVTLLQLPGSNQAVTTEQPYRYDNNPWRGETIAPMAANIQWDVYRDAHQHYLVKMLYNERETRFKADCQPMKADSFYYAFSELQRCYHQQ